jgi:hypothetical protein
LRAGRRARKRIDDFGLEAPAADGGRAFALRRGLIDVGIVVVVLAALSAM